jgi:sodium/hydrogen antiporter
MMEYGDLAVLAFFVFAYSSLASALRRTPVSGALVYVAFGFAVGPDGLGWLHLRVDGQGLKLLAEITLALVLFTDSANADVSVLRRTERIPARLLLLGLPLTIALGAVAGMYVFRDLGVFEIALLATMLAPTDAALGKAVVTNEHVPAEVREGLNVESGLNDGVCVPLIALFLALATGEATGAQTPLLMARLSLSAIGLGAVIGVFLSAVSSRLIRISMSRGWLAGSWLQIPVAALSLTIFAVAQLLGASGFIACFTAGIVFGQLPQDHKKKLLEGAEGTGDTLALVTWVAFGAAVVGPALSEVTGPVLVYAALSLTLVRVVPVFLCLAGTGTDRITRLFMGWFGPRGLASIVFVVIVIGAGLPGQRTLVMTVAWTILLSVLAHGLTAAPLAAAFGARSEASIRTQGKATS